jgi:signal transduction histidine kinase
MGLATMRARAERINADLRIRSEPGSGTVVELRVPLT